MEAGRWNSQGGNSHAAFAPVPFRQTNNYSPNSGQTGGYDMAFQGKGQPASLPSYMLQDPVAYRRPSQQGDAYPADPMDLGATLPVLDRRLSTASSASSHHLPPSGPPPSHYHPTSHGAAPASDIPTYLSGYQHLPPGTNPSPYGASYADTPGTTVAIDAETGRTVKIFTHPAAAYGHLHGGGGTAVTGTLTAQSSVYPSAFRMDLGGLPVYGSTFGAAPSGSSSSGEFQRRNSTLAAAASGRNASLVQRPGDSLPLYITDPSAPFEDLGMNLPPAAVANQDPLSFANKNPMTVGLEELMARRRHEEEHQRYSPQQQKQPHDSMGHSSYHHLSGHPPSFQKHSYQYQSVPRRRSLPLHNGKSSPIVDDDDAYDSLSVVPQNLPDPTPGHFPAVLFCETDEERLTSYQCLLRKQLELFEADEEDVHYSTRQGRTAPIKVGQVGVRCRHCAGLKLSARTKGASYYSQTIEGIYQICQNMSKCHLCDKCVRVPREIRRQLNAYRTDCRRAIKGKDYWSEHVKWLGVYEDPAEGCLRVRRPNGHTNRKNGQHPRPENDTTKSGDVEPMEIDARSKKGNGVLTENATVKRADDMADDGSIVGNSLSEKMNRSLAEKDETSEEKLDVVSANDPPSTRTDRSTVEVDNCDAVAVPAEEADTEQGRVSDAEAEVVEDASEASAREKANSHAKQDDDRAVNVEEASSLEGNDARDDSEEQVDVVFKEKPVGLVVENGDSTCKEEANTTTASEHAKIEEKKADEEDVIAPAETDNGKNPEAGSSTLSLPPFSAVASSRSENENYTNGPESNSLSQ